MPVLFADFWLADQWNSFAAGFIDFHYLIAFYVVGTDWLTVDSMYILSVCFFFSVFKHTSAMLLNYNNWSSKYWGCCLTKMQCSVMYIHIFFFRRWIRDHHMVHNQPGRSEHNPGVDTFLPMLKTIQRQPRGVPASGQRWEVFDDILCRSICDLTYCVREPRYVLCDMTFLF